VEVWEADGRQLRRFACTDIGSVQKLTWDTNHQRSMAAGKLFPPFLDSLDEVCSLPDDIQSAGRNLAEPSIDVDYHPETLASPAHWIYGRTESLPITVFYAFKFRSGAVGVMG